MTSYKGLTIQGYQSHVDSYVPFAPGLTVITGPSGHGKTGILRSLRWLAFGEPKGDDFLHTLYNPDGSVKSQAEETKVILTRSDNVTVEKVRRKKKTLHKISTMETPFEKSDTPQEVKDLTGLQVYQFGDFDNALNFAFQLEAPFLLSESPSAGAKVLGKLAGTEAVDKAIKSVSKDTHKVRTERDKAKDDMDARDGDLLSYLFLDDARQAYKACTDIMELVDNSLQVINKLKELSVTYAHNKDVVEDCQSKLKQYEGIDAAKSIMDNMQQDLYTQNMLYELDQRYKYSDAAFRTNTDKLARLKDIELIANSLDMIAATYRELKQLEDLNNKSTACARNVYNFSTELSKYDNLANVAEILQRLGTSNNQLTLYKDLDVRERKAALNYIDIRAKIDQYDDLAELGMILSKMPETTDRLDKLRGYAIRLTTSNMAVRSAEQQVKQRSNDLVAYQKELQDAWDAAGNVCPLCNQTVGGNHAH